MPVPTIPPPPSGDIVTTAPSVNSGGAIPPPPSGSIVMAGQTQDNTPPEQWIDRPSGDGVGGFAEDALKGTLKGFSDIGGAVLGTLDVGNSVPGQAFRAVKDFIPEFKAATQAYEQARQSGASISDATWIAMKAGDNSQQKRDAIVKSVKEGIAAFEKNPTAQSVRGIVDAATLLGTAYAGGGALPEAEAPEAATGATEASTTPELPLEAKIQKAVEQSGLPKTVQPPTPEAIQANLQSGVRQVAAKAAQDAGVNYSEPASVRDAFGTASRNVVNNAQADFKALDEASGGRWQRFDDQIKNVQSKMDEVNGIDDEKYANLETRRNEIETLQGQMIEDLKEAGTVDPAIADKAMAQYRRGMALQDVNNAVKGATKRVPVNGAVQEVTDPSLLANRLAKLNDVPPKGGATRLEQAGATDLLKHTDAAQVASTPYQATGQDALANLLRKSSAGSPLQAAKQALGFEPKISHLRSFVEFNKMTPEQQAAFGDVAKARQYLKSGARNDVLKAGVAGAGITALAHATGIDRALLHSLVE